MYYTIQIQVTKSGDKPVYMYCEGLSKSAKLLKNASRFRVRQTFCGWKKTPEERTANETEVFNELEETKAATGIKPRRVLSYTALEKVLRVTKNPDFFDRGLPMQTAQHAVKSVTEDFSNWLKSLKAYKANPDAFLGKPRMPGYEKGELSTFTISNQEAVIYRSMTSDGKEVCELKLPLTKLRIRLPEIDKTSKLKEVTVKPFYGRFLVILTLEADNPCFWPDMPHMAGLDFGTDNIAAIACTDGSSRVYKGGAVLANNQLFAKRMAKAVSKITQGTSKKSAHSAHLDRISLKRENFNRDQLHKISTSIVRWLCEHRVGLLVIGRNPNWKQNASMGKRNNQNFVSLPLYTLRFMIQYKAELAGITVIEQEESYTSKADVTSGDFMPVYGKEKGKPAFSGRRISRGRYRCANGLIVNADCNGAANILRKAVPDAWKATTDFTFLSRPESVSFKTLNPKYNLTVG